MEGIQDPRVSSRSKTDVGESGRRDTEELKVVVQGRIMMLIICELLGHHLQRV